jgi:transcription antitermination protein NusB
MLSRRQLRSKCLQALYAYFQSENPSMAAGEKELHFSIDKVYDLYLYQLSLLLEINEYSAKKIEEKRQKKLPTKEDLNPNFKFINNNLINKLKTNQDLLFGLNKRKINWNGEEEIIKKLFALIVDNQDFIEYMSSREGGFEEDREVLIKLYKKVISVNEDLEHVYEEKSIYWMDDYELVNSMVIKTLKSFTAESSPKHSLMELYNDEVDDKEFVVDLFRKSIFNNKDYEKMIQEKAKNWELDRIALLDILIMKMALCEVLNFPSIPIKVSLNEYIEISKRFSTPKSKVFINGILDKLIAGLKADDKIKKTGRGLID